MAGANSPKDMTNAQPSAGRQPSCGMGPVSKPGVSDGGANPSEHFKMGIPSGKTVTEK